MSVVGPRTFLEYANYRYLKIALAMLRFHLDGIDPGKLLWQVAP